jgi:cytidyltransferase-like protein
MILSSKDLHSFVADVVMVDGSFDPIHEGHIEYFRLASQFGFPVLGNIAPDDWTKKKHSVLLPVKNRAIVLDSIRYISFVTISTVSTAQSLRSIRPKIYAKGADWQLRGGIPIEEQEICDQLDIKVEYLDSVLNSSSQLLKNFSNEDR